MTKSYGDSMDKAREKMEEVGRTVQEKIDLSREPAAEKLQSAAHSLHQKAASLPGGEKVAGFAHNTADKMQATADYVRMHAVQDMMSDVGSFVRKNPGPSLIAAVIVGFLAGRSFRNDA